MPIVPPEGENSRKPVSTYDTRNLGGQETKPQDETRALIASRKVEGTRVLSSAGEAIGSVHDLMIDKRTGRVAFAVIALGGFLGLGERYHPVPWQLLSFDSSRGGYVVGGGADLRDAPTLSADELPALQSGGYDRRLLEFYGVGGLRSDLGPPL